MTRQKYYTHEVLTNCRGRLSFEELELGDEMWAVEMIQLCLGSGAKELLLLAELTSYMGRTPDKRIFSLCCEYASPSPFPHKIFMFTMLFFGKKIFCR